MCQNQDKKSRESGKRFLSLIPVLDAYLLSLGGGFAYSSASIREVRRERREAIKGSTSLSVVIT